MEPLTSPIPEICVSPAPPVEHVDEPVSPFLWPAKVADDDDDSFRPVHLTPPPTGTPRFARQLSPLRPEETLGSAKGLERERFELLLQASKERNAATGGKRASDLRKELALKTQKSKQVERRALFLSKVNAPPSPTAIGMPKTPPESPAIFHYTLPSPGLHSPLALFEAIASEGLSPSELRSREPWVEQVDFRLPADERKKAAQRAPRITVVNPPSRLSRPGKPIPSLDQITARLRSQSGDAHSEAATSKPLPRLPAFLMANSRPSSPELGAPAPPPKTVTPPPDVATKARAPLPIGVGRLRMPVRPEPLKFVEEPAKPRYVPPASPQSPKTPKLQITTTVVPRSSHKSPTELSEGNVGSLSFRDRTRKDMLTALKRRTIVGSERGLNGHDDEPEEDERKGRRISAPAELQARARYGFEHPVLSLPGGF